MIRLTPRNWGRYLLPILAAYFPISIATAQPINDSLKARLLRNEKMYRMLTMMEPRGASYQFTNVTAWKITDDDLKNQIIKVYQAQYGDKQLKNFDINSVYVFAAPIPNSDKFQPFHVLFMGRHVNNDTSGGAEDAFFGGGRRKSNNNEDVPIAFFGRDVVRTLIRQPGLFDNINAIQGEIVELPTDIMPSGVQLIKNSTQRYIYHQMFTGFYSKRQIIDEQNRSSGGPTIDEQFTIDSSAAIVPTDPDQSMALPDEQVNSRAFRYQRLVDLAADHLTVNISRNNALEIQLGNPEVGLPFWSSGEGRLWLDMKNQIGSESDFKIGLDFPLNLGREDALTFNHRRLSGFWGGSVDAYFAGIDFFSAFNMPLQFSFSVIPAGGYNSSIIYSGTPGSTLTNGASVPGSQTFFRTAFIGQISIPIILQLDPANFIQLSAGVGIHSVKLSFIPGDSDIAPGHFASGAYGQDQVGKVQDLLWLGRSSVSTPFTPHVALEFVNHRANKFGVNFQYDHLFTFGTWLELIPDHLRIEGSYTAPLVRDAKPYEPPYFFMFTPRIYF